MENLLPSLQKMRTHFTHGFTNSYDFRRQQLIILRKAILHYEKELHDALYADLKKSAEESWVTETGFVLSEISHTLKHLKVWMCREKVPTNLLNFPSRSYIYKEALGTVLIVAPWNYPFQLLFNPFIGAIAAGNCVVLKPSEFAPATAAVMKKLIEENFSKDYVLYVEGDGAQVVPAMMNDFRFDHVFYTGSTQVGKSVYEMAAKKLVPVTLELGGKSPCVVESDANIKVAARRIAMTKFSNAGQMCVAPDYVLLHDSIKHVFINALKDCIHKFFSNDPATSNNYGKIINEEVFSRLINYIKQGDVISGGKYNAATHYIEPTILENIPVDATVMDEEIFGPVLPIVTFDTFEEAKIIIQKHANPLAFYVFTESAETEKKWLKEIAFGGGCVNNSSWHLTNPHLPFGGRGNSGIGAYHGKESFLVFSHRKSVMKTPTWLDPSIKYPPFNGKLKLFKKIIK